MQGLGLQSWYKDYRRCMLMYTVACWDVHNSLQPSRSSTLAALISKQHAWQLAGVPNRPKYFVTVNSVAFQLTVQYHSWITGLDQQQSRQRLL